jgi:hypothetical protein
MGACCSWLFPSPGQQKVTEQFEALVTPKPAPVSLVDVAAETDSDVPLFAPTPADDDDAEISDVEVLPDSDDSDAPARR